MIIESLFFDAELERMLFGDGSQDVLYAILFPEFAGQAFVGQ